MPYRDPEIQREYQKQYRRENREHLLEYDRAWKSENLEHVRELKRTWIKTDKGKACIQRSHITRRDKERVVINTLTSAEWLDILEDYGYKCAYCGKEFSSSNMPMRDHIIPISRGGNNTKENIKPACKSCNSKKGTMLIEEILSTLNNK